MLLVYPYMFNLGQIASFMLAIIILIFININPTFFSSVHSKYTAIAVFRLSTHTHTYHRFMALFPGLTGSAGARRNLLLDFMVQGEISEADT